MKNKLLPPPDHVRAEAVLARYRALILDGMRGALRYPGVQHLRYTRYHLGWEDADGNRTDAGAGKLLRPALCLLACEAAGGVVANALPAAIAIELLHNFTLIHDDIEDRSETRHGRATLWTVAGVPQAINTGDGLYALAHRQVLRLREAGLPPEQVLEAVRILDDACIALCEGQHADIAFESRTSVTLDEYRSMITGKTAALLGASTAVGAVAAGAAQLIADGLARFGILLGLAFQIHDDVLGIWADASVTGKPVADDIRLRKKSYPVAYALSRLPEADRADLERAYSTEARDDDGVGAIVMLLERAGAREAARSAAEAAACTGIDLLRTIDLVPDRRDDLEALAAFFVQRDA